MRSFDPQKPLIFIHVPKSAGTAVKNIFTGWYPRRLHLHYYDESQARMPIPVSGDMLGNVTVPPVIYGHFNKLRGFGVEDYYPNVSQFITILRDPLETAVSRYFYVRKQSEDWEDESRVPVGDLETHLSQVTLNVLNHFPREMNLTNFKDIIDEYFVEIGITERLPESLGRIAKKLGQHFDPATLDVVNVTERDQAMPIAYRDRFVEDHPLEFAVYEYAKAQLDTPL